MTDTFAFLHKYRRVSHFYQSTIPNLLNLKFLNVSRDAQRFSPAIRTDSIVDSAANIHGIIFTSCSEGFKVLNYAIIMRLLNEEVVQYYFNSGN